MFDGGESKMDVFARWGFLARSLYTWDSDASVAAGAVIVEVSDGNQCGDAI